MSTESPSIPQNVIPMFTNRIMRPPLGTVGNTTVSGVPESRFIVAAGQAGLAVNEARRAAFPTVNRNDETAQSGATATVGANGTPGLPGATVAGALKPVNILSAITGPAGSGVTPVAVGSVTLPSNCSGHRRRKFPVVALVAGVALGIGLAVIL